MTWQPFFVDGAERSGRWCITCDHATNTVPSFVGGGDLGLHPKDMARHIAYDPGAAGVAHRLGELLQSPVISSNFSRLVIDPNRGEDDPTILMRLYDGSVIPANKHADAAERELRLERCYRPYHAALAELMAPPERVLVAVHSFTPQLQGRPPRPWHIGILHTGDVRLARPLFDLLDAEDDLCVGENVPYGGHLPGDSVDRHATRTGQMNALIELRQDIISSQSQQHAWAERLAPILAHALARVVAI